MFVVGLFELVLNDDLVVSICAEDIELKVAYTVLGSFQDKLAQAEHFC